MFKLFKVTETRAVARLGPWVFKMAMSRRGVKANTLEWQLWGHYERYPLHIWLVPTWTIYGLVNIQPYAGPTIPQMTYEHRAYAKVLGILDPHESNIVQSYKGRWAFCDYACQRAMCEEFCHEAPCKCIGVDCAERGW